MIEISNIALFILILVLISTNPFSVNFYKEKLNYNQYSVFDKLSINLIIHIYFFVESQLCVIWFPSILQIYYFGSFWILQYLKLKHLFLRARRNKKKRRIQKNKINHIPFSMMFSISFSMMFSMMFIGPIEFISTCQLIN